MSLTRPTSVTSKNGMIEDLFTISCNSNDITYVKKLFEYGSKLLFPHVYGCLSWCVDYNTKYGTMPNRTAVLDSDFSDFWTDNPSDDSLKFLYEKYWGEQAIRSASGITNEMRNNLNGTNIDLINDLYSEMRKILPPVEVPVVDAFKEDWESIFDPSKNQSLDIGLPIIDNNIKGINPGEQLVLAGDTNVGKSWILCYMAAYQLVRGRNVVLVTGEMNKESVIQRISSFVTQINPKILRNKDDIGLMHTLKPIFLEGIKFLSDKGGKLYIFDGTYSADSILLEIDKIGENDKALIDIVFVDGQYLMKTNNGSSGRDWQIQAQLASDFYLMAFQNGIRLVTTNQLGRGNSGSTDIGNGDISGSYDYARFASYMVGIIKPEVATESGNTKLPVLLFKTLKMRDGDVGLVDAISVDTNNVTYYKRGVTGDLVDMMKDYKLVNTYKHINPFAKTP